MNDSASRLEADYEARLEAEADAALDRIQHGQTWSDWLKIGELLVWGRLQAMNYTHTNRPAGKGYNIWFGGWLERHPKLRAIDKATRNHCMQCFDDAAAIEQWRSTLGRNQREAINHPTVVLRRFRKEQGGERIVSQAKKQSAREAMVERIDVLEADNKRLREQVKALEAALAARRKGGRR